MKDIVTYLGGVIASFLPPRYRPDVDRGMAVLSGIIETMLALLILIFRAIVGMQGRTMSVDLRTDAIGGGIGIPGSGIFLLAEFWLNPLHLLLFYFVVEGIVRAMAAHTSHQVFGLGPLYIISALHNRVDRKTYERSIGPAVVDKVVRGDEQKGFDLKVYSCRPKLHWNPYITVEFEGEFYQYFKEGRGSLPRRFVYYLRRNPIGRIVVVVDHYRVDNVLKAEPDKWAGTPTFLEKAFPKWNLPPLVADEIVRGDGVIQDYDLKIYRCRPKRDWTAYVTIEFEEQWYQLIKDERGSKPRPYIYYLRKAAMTHPAAVIRPYKPDDVLNESNTG